MGFQNEDGGKSKDSKNPPIHKQSMNLKPLSEFSVPFISVTEWEKAAESNKQLQKNMWYLNKALQTNKQNLDNHMKRPPKLFPLLKAETIRCDDQRYYQVLVTLSNEYVNDAFEEQKSSYEKSIDLINEMIDFCDNVIENKHPVSVDIKQFLDALNKTTNDQDKIKLTNKRIYAFQQLIKKNSSKQQPPPAVTSKQLIQAIYKAIPKFDIDAKYMSEGESDFDDVYENYANSELKEEYDVLLDLISQFQYKRALDCLHENVIKLLQSFNIYVENDEKYFLVFYSAVKYLFSRVTIESPYILENGLESKFFSNCDYLQHQTPNQLQALKYLFPPSQYNRTLNDIFHSDQLLAKAIDWISLLNFHSSPINIARLAANAISVLNVYIARSIYINKTMKGDESAEIPENLNMEMGAICFDDIFTLFYMSFAVEPPANSIAIRDYLNAFGKFTQSGTLDYASTTIQATIKHIFKED